MKVLAGHPEGRASVADVKQYLAVLVCSGADWSQRMKRLAARAPDLDIFSSGYVLREPGGWQITEAGRAFLTLIESPVPEPAFVEPEALLPIAAEALDLPRNVIRFADYVAERRRPAA
jgi:hypothetical protein